MRKLILILALIVTVGAIPPNNRPLFENNSSYRVDAVATFTTNRLFRAQSRSVHSIASDVTLTFDNAFNVAGLYTTLLAAGYSAGSEFDTYIGYHSALESFFYDLGLVKFKFQAASQDNHVEAYQRIGYHFNDYLFTFSLYQEIDSSHDELLDTIIRLTKGFTPRYYGSDLRVQNSFMNLLVGYSTIKRFYIQSDFSFDSIFIPNWNIVLTPAFSSSSTDAFFGLKGFEFALAFERDF